MIRNLGAASPKSSLSLSAAAGRLRQGIPLTRTAQPPEDHGQRLATLLRSSRDGSADEEIRVAWTEFNGRPFLSIRTWTHSGEGWWPTKAGISVRLRELADFAEAVSKALELAEEHLAASGESGQPGT